MIGSISAILGLIITTIVTPILVDQVMSYPADSGLLHYAAIWLCGAVAYASVQELVLLVWYGKQS